MQHLIEQFDEKEYELACGLDKEIRRVGVEAYFAFLQGRTYSVAEHVSKMSPNELLVFEDALARFRTVQGGKTQTH